MFAALNFVPLALLPSGQSCISRSYPSKTPTKPKKMSLALAKINKNISIHCARHSFATIAGELGVPVEVIKELLGHSNINITLGYVKMFPSKLLSSF